VGQPFWHIEHTHRAAKGLRKLDKPMLQRIRKYMDEVAALENPRDRGKPMTANKTGLWRYRIGDYRMICDIQDHQLVIVAVDFGHRRDVYDD